MTFSNGPFPLRASVRSHEMKTSITGASDEPRETLRPVCARTSYPSVATREAGKPKTRRDPAKPPHRPKRPRPNATRFPVSSQKQTPNFHGTEQKQTPNFHGTERRQTEAAPRILRNQLESARFQQQTEADTQLSRNRAPTNRGVSPHFTQPARISSFRRSIRDANSRASRVRSRQCHGFRLNSDEFEPSLGLSRPSGLEKGDALTVK